VHDLPTARPAAVDCGWPPALIDHVPKGEDLRNTGGLEIRLRKNQMSLVAMLQPVIAHVRAEQPKLSPT
jgi:hypothetical protein